MNEYVVSVVSILIQRENKDVVAKVSWATRTLAADHFMDRRRREPPLLEASLYTHVT